jgi:hypothetical protein
MYEDDYEDIKELDKKFKEICKGHDEVLERICSKYDIRPEYIKKILYSERLEVYKKKRANIFKILKEIVDIIATDND